jgi:hypothetical protein
MAAGPAICVALLTCVCVSLAQAQGTVLASVPSSWTLRHRPVAAASASINEALPLTVPKGTPLQIVLDKELRIQKVGQSVDGRVAEPVYAFDKLVVPVGTEVTGHITQLKPVSGGKRFLDALNANFSPARKVQIEFDDLKLIDGRHIPIHTTVTPGSGKIIQFITGAEGEKKKGVKGSASDEVGQAEEEARRQWDNAMKQVREAGKMHKVKRYVVAQLPVHPQSVDAGTIYFAELQTSLDFGTEPLTPEMASSISTPLPGSLVHARLMTGLSSATTQKGEEIEAVLSQPLFDGNRLLLPEGSLLRGSVTQVRPARRFSRNGQLRMVLFRANFRCAFIRHVDYFEWLVTRLRRWPARSVADRSARSLGARA